MFEYVYTSFVAVIISILSAVGISAPIQDAPYAQNAPGAGDYPSTEQPELAEIEIEDSWDQDVADIERTLSEIDEQVTGAVNTSTSTSTGAPLATSGVSRSELKLHAQVSDCWVAFEGNVYDITKVVSWHPGGASKIEPYCGTVEEFETAFARKHGTKMVSVMLKMATKKGLLQ